MNVAQLLPLCCLSGAVNFTTKYLIKLLHLMIQNSKQKLLTTTNTHLCTYVALFGEIVCG